MKALKIIGKIISVIVQIPAVLLLAVGTALYFTAIFINDPKATFTVVKTVLQKIKEVKS